MPHNRHGALVARGATWSCRRNPGAALGWRPPPRHRSYTSGHRRLLEPEIGWWGALACASRRSKAYASPAGPHALSKWKPAGINSARILARTSLESDESPSVRFMTASRSAMREPQVRANATCSPQRIPLGREFRRQRLVSQGFSRWHSSPYRRSIMWLPNAPNIPGRRSARGGSSRGSRVPDLRQQRGQSCCPHRDGGVLPLLLVQCGLG